MHKKYAKEGLEIFAVGIEDPADEDTASARKKTIEKLNSLEATFTYVPLDAKPEEWEAKLKIDGPPGIYVFNRGNQFVRKQPIKGDKQNDEVKYETIGKDIDALFTKKK